LTISPDGNGSVVYAQDPGAQFAYAALDTSLPQ